MMRTDEDGDTDMTKDELKELECKAYIDYQNALREIYCRYSLDNNPYRVGDIVKDHIGYARITRVIAGCGKGFSGEPPSCTYECDNLTKKLEINKREPRRVVFQKNIITE